MSAISTAEQNGWAEVATGSAEYAPWVRQRQRMYALLAETRRENAVHRAINELRRAWNDPAGIYSGDFG